MCAGQRVSEVEQRAASLMSTSGADGRLSRELGVGSSARSAVGSRPARPAALGSARPARLVRRAPTGSSDSASRGSSSASRTVSGSSDAARGRQPAQPRRGRGACLGRRRCRTASRRSSGRPRAGRLGTAPAPAGSDSAGRRRRGAMSGRPSRLGRARRGLAGVEERPELSGSKSEPAGSGLRRLRDGATGAAGSAQPARRLGAGCRTATSRRSNSEPPTAGSLRLAFVTGRSAQPPRPASRRAGSLGGLVPRRRRRTRRRRRGAVGLGRRRRPSTTWSRRLALDRGEQHLRDVEDLDLLAGRRRWPAAAVSPSESITRQNGQPTAIWSAPVATASLVRFTLIRSPMVSSIHIRAPPAPQQKDRSELRGISTTRRRAAPGAARAAASRPGCGGRGSTGRGR